MSIRGMRRTVQASGILFLVAVPVLNRKGITWVTGTLYSLAVGPVWITDPVIGVQAMLTTRAVDLVLLLSLGVPLLITLVFGRVYCGWFCPQNTLSELVDRLAAKLGLRRQVRSSSAVPRYAVLAVVLAVTLGARFPLVSLLSAPGILSVQTARYLYEGTVGLELALIGFIVAAELLLVRRAWCRFCCPVGGFLGLFRVRRTMKVAFSESPDAPCGRCNACADVCQLGLDPVGGDLYPQCHNCGDCVAACGEMTGGKHPLAFRF